MVYVLVEEPVLLGSARTADTFSKELRRRYAELLVECCSACNKPEGRTYVISAEVPVEDARVCIIRPAMTVTL